MPAALEIALIVLAALLLLYGLLVAVLVITGRRGEARTLARLLPDCTVLLKRLLRDPRVPRRHKLTLALTAAYLASPIDIVPDFIPVAGHLDDAVVVVLALRMLVRGAGADLVRAHWPGPPGPLKALLRMAGVAT